MNSAVIQLLVLAGIAIFLILRLRSVLGTRDGFEKPPSQADPADARAQSARRDFEVIEGGVDRDITDHVDEASDAARALSEIKAIEPGFSVTEFLQGAKGAYEMILMAFERGELGEVKPFLSGDVYDAFAGVVEDRESKGLIVEADFVGVRETKLTDARYDPETNAAEVSVRFVGEMTSVVRDSAGDIIEGSPEEIKKQRDVWTFEREIGSGNPNWQLVATGE